MTQRTARLRIRRRLVLLGSAVSRRRIRVVAALRGTVGIVGRAHAARRRKPGDGKCAQGRDDDKPAYPDGLRHGTIHIHCVAEAPAGSPRDASNFMILRRKVLRKCGRSAIWRGPNTAALQRLTGSLAGSLATARGPRRRSARGCSCQGRSHVEDPADRDDVGHLSAGHQDVRARRDRPHRDPYMRDASHPARGPRSHL